MSGYCYRLVLFFAASCPGLGAIAAPVAPPEQPQFSSAGLSVVIAPQPAADAVKLARDTPRIVYVPLADAQAVAATRREVEQAGLLGTRVYVEQADLRRLPLADNLVNDVRVDREMAGQVERADLLRVTRPLGTVDLGGERLTKPWPDGADDWSHPYYAPDNNPQSRDRLARGPYLTQFLAEPWYCPMPEVTVAARGRVYKAFGHIAYKEREWPWLNMLVALDGFNGGLLWKRPLEPNFMIHRNTLIAAGDLLYLGDNRSCKVIDGATGADRGEIVAPPGAAGPCWKWMALVDGVLYALLGDVEPPDDGRRDARKPAGWPWKPMSAGYDSENYRWGFGRTLAAIDPVSRRVIWQTAVEQDIDGRAVCLRGGRIYAYAHPHWLACFDARTGQSVWRNDSAELLDAIGPHDRAQIYTKGFSSSAYLKCSAEALFFAGPQRTRLVAVAADDGRLLWKQPEGNYQLVIRDEGLYALGRLDSSKLIEPLSGRVLQEFANLRGNCTRATGAVDAIFCRGQSHGGTLRLTAPDHSAERMALMRPDCHDGVIIAGGMLYWGPWMCDCNLSLVGIIGMTPAGGFPTEQPAQEAQRLQRFATALAKRVVAQPGDWPAYRADSHCSAASDVALPPTVCVAWTHTPPVAAAATAPITLADLVVTSGADGAIRALDVTTGQRRWTFHTGGALLFPPAAVDGRLVAGSSDGWVYALNADDGQLLWRFQAAPAPRKIPVYGRLSSTWPVAGGVAIDRGVVYAAAGLASYDGTHVYALDAADGHLRWQNNTSGNLRGAGAGAGVSVQGHLMVQGERLYLAGGNVVSPAEYDLSDGRCLNDLDSVWRKAPRGRDLFLVDGKVTAFDRLLYAPTAYQVGRYYPGQLVQAEQQGVLIRGLADRLVRVDRRSPNPAKPQSLWESRYFTEVAALALGANAVVAAGVRPGKADEPPQPAVVALDLEDGQVRWELPLPAPVVSWGVALDHAGRIVVALDDGRTLGLTAQP